MRELQKVMDMETDGDDPNFGPVLRAKVSGATAALGTQVKVDENQMRAAVINKLPELLEALKEEQIKLAERRARSS